MSKDSETTKVPTDVTDESSDDNQKTFDGDYVKGLRDEAAQHRQRAATAEAEAQELRDWQFERVMSDSLTDVLADPQDLLVFGNKDDLLTDGKADPEKVAAAAKALLELKPHLRKFAGFGSVNGGARSGTYTGPSPIDKFSDMLNGSASD